MDKYLIPDSNLNRLRAEYAKYGSLIVAVDFDDTLFDFHQTGGSYDMVKQLVRDLYGINCHIIIWTGNQDKVFVEKYLSDNKIPYHSINEDHQSQVKEHKPRKCYANVYIDDRAGLIQVYQELSTIVKENQK